MQTFTRVEFASKYDKITITIIIGSFCYDNIKKVTEYVSAQERLETTYNYIEVGLSASI